MCGAEDEGFGVHRLTRASEEALQKHRMQSHVPFDPRCTLCARGKSVFHHRRRRANMLETEVQADFAFLTTRGEVVSEDAPGTIKVLVLTELSSGCIGYVVVESDVSKVRTEICRWLEHFGLTSTTTGVILHTDAERAVAELVGKSSERYTFNVRRANPQQHQSVGAAERAVRRLKESLSVLRADLNSGGADVTFNESGLADALTYIGLTHNHFSKVQGSDMSPLEFTVNRPLSKPATALFGQTVLAELPSSLRQLCPNETRGVEACFVHPGLNTGPVVQGIFRVDGEQVLKRFVARNLRPIFPIAWNHSLGADVLMKFDNASVEDLDAQPAVADEPVRQPQVGVDSAPEESNIVEYPDGAPPEVIREMKEPDDAMPFHPKRSGVKRPIKSAPSSGGLKLARQGPLAHQTPNLPEPQSRPPEPEPTTPSPPTESDPVTSSPPPEGMERSKRLRVFPKTHKCPACQSGMEAPGIRHSAACKRKRLEFERIQAEEESSSPHADSAMDVIPASPVPPPALSPEPVTVPAEIRAADLRGRKRESEQSAEDLEAEMHEGNDTMELESVSLDLRWSDNGDYMLSPMELEMHGQKCLATSPEFFDDLISSVKFSPDKKHTFCKMTLGGASVLVWKPDGLVDDSSLMSLDNEQGFEGMKEEIRNLEHCRTGRIIDHTELTALKAQNPHLRLIPSRWVSAYKSPTRVRARIVAKDLNRGVSARKLGISSPTPSIDGLHFVLALAAQRQWQLKGLDVAHAFMHSPIPKSECIALQMPQSVSLVDGSLAYLVLYRALNGPRDASLAWLNLLSESIKAVGLVTDDMEPCIYQGCIRRKGRSIGSAVLIAYVDDLLLCSDSDEVEKVVEETIGAVVPLKETGKIKKAAQGGGALTFIGRHIFRDGHKNDLKLGVDPKFLDAVFKEFNI